MDYNAPPNFCDFINNVLQMGVQNKIRNKAMRPCFQIPNAPAVNSSHSSSNAD